MRRATNRRRLVIGKWYQLNYTAHQPDISTYIVRILKKDSVNVTFYDKSSKHDDCLELRPTTPYYFYRLPILEEVLEEVMYQQKAHDGELYEV